MYYYLKFILPQVRFISLFLIKKNLSFNTNTHNNIEDIKLKTYKNVSNNLIFFLNNKKKYIVIKEFMYNNTNI